MIIPAEFARLTAAFWQGSREMHGSNRDWLLNRLATISKADRIAARKFLDQLLEAATEDQCQAAWQAGSSDYWINPAKPFLAELRDALVAQEAAQSDD